MSSLGPEAVLLQRWYNPCRDLTQKAISTIGDAQSIVNQAGFLKVCK